jgi:hypothetical protein
LIRINPQLRFGENKARAGKWQQVRASTSSGSVEPGIYRCY